MPDWREITRLKGYSDSKNMLVDQYYLYDKSIEQVAEFLSLEPIEIIKKMNELNLPRRSKGGPNNSNLMRCPNCGKLDAAITGGFTWEGDFSIHIRWRKCRSCKTTFKTAEKMLNTNEKYS